MKTFLVIVFFIMLAGVLRAPAFLVCEQPVKKADCVIAMLGGDFELRRQEALSLIEKGNVVHSVQDCLHKHFNPCIFKPAILIHFHAAGNTFL